VPKIEGHFSFPARPAGHVPLGTRQAVGIHTGAGGQCADAIEAGVIADRPECIQLHTGTGSGSLGQMEGGVRAAYICPVMRAALLVIVYN